MRADGSIADKLAGVRRHSGHFPTCETTQEVRGGNDILHLLELVPIVRRHLRLEKSFSDDAILASLKVLVSTGNRRTRVRIAFESSLGQHFLQQNRDLPAAVVTLLALLPEAWD